MAPEGAQDEVDAPAALPGSIATRFGGLLASLSRAHYPIDPQARAAAYGILVDEVARSGTDLSRLRHRLTPIFATDAESQADIGRRPLQATAQIDQLDR